MKSGELKVVIAGCYTLDPGAVAMHLLLGEQGHEGWGGLSRLPVGATVLLRAPLRGSPGPVESMAASLCETLGIPVEWRTPEPGAGGAGTIERDRKMVDDSDAVITYVDFSRTDEGGTERVKRMGFTMGKHCWSFAPVKEGPVTYVGAADPAPSWTSA